MKLIAFAATLHRESINKQLATHVAKLAAKASAQVEVDVLDLNDFEAPLYSQEREAAQGVPAAAHAFLEKIQQADALIISFAEHNGSYSAAYKSLFDWCSRVVKKVYGEKRVLLLSTSPGPSGGKSVLAAAVNSMPHFGAEVVGSLSLPRFRDNFDVESGVSDPELSAALAELVAKLVS